MGRGSKSSRSIPAQAGEPAARTCGRRRTRVYPRAGGGTIFTGQKTPSVPGLSPRRRGNRRGGSHRIGRAGSIPAQAGEPHGGTCQSEHRRVYPRAGGGTGFGRLIELRHAGLSPRRRGNRTCPSSVTADPGSIPAQAGEPYTYRRLTTLPRVYPRAGGGTTTGTARYYSRQGLSPRRRGNPRVAVRVLRKPGSIPAQAGEPVRVLRTRSIPAIGGGTISESSSPLRSPGLSPRRRGNPVETYPLQYRLGSIPAQAGEP